MECTKCGARLAGFEDLMTYLQDNGGVHLALLPERQHTVLNTLRTSKGKRFTEVACPRCSTEVGKIVPVGPYSTSTVCFDPPAVRVNGVRFQKKDKWKLQTRLHPLTTSRTASNYFGAPVRQAEQAAVAPETVPCFPRADEKEKFRWDDILLEKAPHPEQLQGFVECMLRDTVVVMPTGAGKTLVSAMVLSRMARINPKLMGLVVVDRIPLVFQQSDVVERESGLSVEALCGATITPKKVERVAKREADVLVGTADLVWNLVEGKKVPLTLFHTIVVDECHHAKGAHSFARLLGAVRSLRHPPRIVGLTASPIEPAATLSESVERLETFLSVFPSPPVVFCPEVPPPDIATEWVEGCDPPDLVGFLSSLHTAFVAKAHDAVDLCPGAKCPDRFPPLIPKIRGELLAVGRHDLLQLVRAYEVGMLLGSGAAKDFLPVNHSLRESPDVETWRLRHLKGLLRAFPQESKALVFVPTQEGALRLADELDREFHHLCPTWVVGHGGAHGMQWCGEQEEALRAFRRGTARLLVATSVLDEGLDVQGCDLVVRYAGVDTVTRFIQSRGRARKQGSRFVVLGPTKEMEAGQQRLREVCLTRKSVGTGSVNALCAALEADSILENEAARRRAEGSDYESSEMLLTAVMESDEDVVSLLHNSGVQVLRKERCGLATAALGLHNILSPTAIALLLEVEANGVARKVLQAHHPFLWHRVVPEKLHGEVPAPGTMFLGHWAERFAVAEEELLDTLVGPVSGGENLVIGKLTIPPSITLGVAFVAAKGGGIDLVIPLCALPKLDIPVGFDGTPLLVVRWGRTSSANLDSLHCHLCSLLEGCGMVPLAAPLLVRATPMPRTPLPFPVRWSLGVLEAMRNIMVPRSLQSILDKLDPRQAEQLLDGVWAEWYLKVIDLEECGDDCFIPDGCVPMRRALVTPCCSYPLPTVAIPESRLTRLCKGRDLVVVSFRGDNKLKTYGKHAKWIWDKVEKGVKIVGHSFHFLCCSASQLRDHQAIFVRCKVPEDAEALRETLVRATEFRTVRKYVTRMGLLASPGDMIGEVHDVGETDDILAQDGTCVTDGSGYVRADVLAAHYADPPPKAVQIRFAGYKGVLVTVPEGGHAITVRPSMLKFVYPSSELWVVRPAACIPLSLNQEVITLLSSFKVPNLFETLRELQHSVLEACLAAHSTSDGARALLSKYLDRDVLASVNGKEGFHCEAWWASLLRRACHHEVQAVLEGRIPVTKGCRAMGIPDPTASLTHGEVFLLRSDGGVVTGKVMVFRNPSLHPGDLRVLDAVDRPELHYWTDVLVFPAVPDCPTSTPSECSGGDLDGDEFGVVWDARLIPSDPHPPLRPTETAVETVHTTSVNSQREIAEYYTQCIVDDVVGQLARQHMALCDQIPEGAQSPLALKVAEAHAIAIDAVKTGRRPHIPLTEDLAFPEFMRHVRNGYQSPSILGRLYRLALSVTEELPTDEENDVEVEVGEVDSAEMHEACRVYRRYSRDLERVLRLHGLSDEIDAFLGRPLKWDPLTHTSQRLACASLAGSIASLRAKYRAEFERGVTDRRQRAWAWHAAATRYRSFAWLVPQAPPHLTIPVVSRESLVGGSALKAVRSQAQTIGTLAHRYDEVREMVNPVPPGTVLLPFGSASMFLNARESDLDLVLVPPGAADRREGPFAHLSHPIPDTRDLLCTLQGTLLPLSEEQVENVGGTLRVFLSPGEAISVECDIGFQGDKLVKTAVMWARYHQQPAFFVAARVVLAWARQGGVVKRGNTSGRGLDTADLYAVLLLLLPPTGGTQGPLRTPASLSEAWKVLEAMVAKVEPHEVGSMLLTFFRSLSNSGELRYVWPVLDQEVVVPSETVRWLSFGSTRASYILATTRSVPALLRAGWADSIPRTSRWVLPQRVSNSMAHSLSFHQTRLSKLTGASVTLELSRRRRVKVGATGQPRCLEALFGELHRMTVVARGLRLGYSVNSYASEATYLALLGQQGGEPVGTVDHSGASQPGHRVHHLSRFVGVGSTPPPNPLPGLRRRLSQQLRDAPEPVSMAVRFGRFYALNTARLLRGKTPSLAALSEILTKRPGKKVWMRSGFSAHTYPSIDDQRLVEMEQGVTKALEQVGFAAMEGQRWVYRIGLGLPGRRVNVTLDRARRVVDLIEDETRLLHATLLSLPSPDVRITVTHGRSLPAEDPLHEELRGVVLDEHHRPSKSLPPYLRKGVGFVRRIVRCHKYHLPSCHRVEAKVAVGEHYAEGDFMYAFCDLRVKTRSASCFNDALDTVLPLHAELTKVMDFDTPIPLEAPAPEPSAGMDDLSSLLGGM
eukprot:Sspe_Gene.95706::Locus_68020_Transcript_1_1_Confidence_1.000_Length_7047::g.95706::m.95706/K11699/RDR, RDRP; RNA-dependent RNA polymerase